MATAKNSQQTALDSLARLLKPGQILSKPFELITYEIDAANDRGHPDAVVFPRSGDEVAQIVRWAAEHRIPLVARGAGTGLSGGAVAEQGGIILEFSHMNHIKEFDILGRSVIVESGVVNLKLDEYVKKVGLYFPPDPASGRSATIGGNVAENAGGPHCFKYGVTTNYLTGMEIVLADGRTIHLGGRALDYPEYDLIGIITGSEGTLAIINEVSARLLRNPPAVKTMMAAFDSVENAGEAVSAIIARGLVPATMEFMDQKMMQIIEDYAHAGLPTRAGAALIIEVDGYPESLSLQMDEIVTILREHEAWDLRVAQTAEERDKIWYGRKSAAGAMARLSPSYYLLDGTVPRSKLARTLRTINQICKQLELRVGYVFHAGDGNLHPFILIEDPKNPELVKRVYQAGQEIMEECVRHDGSITGEHGVGIEKRKFMSLMYDNFEMQSMLDLKRVFDPGELLNPGKIFPTQYLSQENSPTAIAAGDTSIRAPGAQTISPQSLKEAVEVLQAWMDEGRSIRIRGGGTKSSLLPDIPQVLSTNRLSGICLYALEDLYVTVNAGTTLEELQAELARDRMWVPLFSPWKESTIGGIIATNFNAPLRMRYGSVRDLVLASTVVLPDGRVIRAGRPVVKNVAGYDMPKLFVGSHGTLGLITDVTLKLAPLPRARASLIAPVDDLADGLEWSMKLLQVCLVASSLLLCRGCDGFSSAPFSLIYTAEGVPEDVAAELAQARNVLQASGAAGLVQMDQPSGSEAWMNWIRAGIPNPAYGGTLTSLIRLGIAPKDLPSLLESQKMDLNGSAFFADLASGQLYIQAGPESGIDLVALRAAAHKIGGYAVLMATPDASKGVDPWGYSPESLQLMRKIKSRWDARGLLNPGAFLL